MPFSNETRWRKAQLAFEFSDSSDGFHVEFQRPQDGKSLWLLNGDRGFHMSAEVGEVLMRFLNGEEVRGV